MTDPEVLYPAVAVLAAVVARIFPWLVLLIVMFLAWLAPKRAAGMDSFIPIFAMLTTRRKQFEKNALRLLRRIRQARQKPAS